MKGASCRREIDRDEGEEVGVQVERRGIIGMGWRERERGEREKGDIRRDKYNKRGLVVLGLREK